MVDCPLWHSCIIMRYVLRKVLANAHGLLKEVTKSDAFVRLTGKSIWNKVMID